jgi:hypothetical protein
MEWSGVLRPCQHEKLARGAQDTEHAMFQKLNSAIAVIGIDIGKNLTNGARWVVQAERVGAVRHARKRLGLG